MFGTSVGFSDIFGKVLQFVVVGVAICFSEV